LSTRLTTEVLINLLFEHLRRPDGSTYTSVEVADGSGVSTAQISSLRSGRRDNPTLEVIHKLMDFFEVPMAYLDAKSEAQAIEILRYKDNLRFRNTDSQLGIEEYEKILEIMRWIRADERARMEGKATPPKPWESETGE
jgi:transcriptional regulator with XRE-family HTH domain